jgi:hypothetical protein
MITEQQKLLSQLYELEDSIKHILFKNDMFEELYLMDTLIHRLEYNIVNDSSITMGI